MGQTRSHHQYRITFLYDVDSVVLESMSAGTMVDWSKVELQAICRRHSLSVCGSKAVLRCTAVTSSGKHSSFSHSHDIIYQYCVMGGGL